MAEALVVTRLEAFYGALKVLHGVSLGLARGEVLALIGANGAGKSTLLRAIAGLLPVRGQEIRLEGTLLAGRPAHLIARQGIALVPEGRRLFADLTVLENLQIGAETRRPGPWTLSGVLELFPALAQRQHHKPGQLSGGQQQMVAIGRALMQNPSIVMFDEVSLGLAPKITAELYAAFPAILATGLGAIIVEQDIGRALAVADRFLCLREGAIVLEGAARAADRDAITAAYFGAST